MASHRLEFQIAFDIGNEHPEHTMRPLMTGQHGSQTSQQCSSNDGTGQDHPGTEDREGDTTGDKQRVSGIGVGFVVHENLPKEQRTEALRHRAETSLRFLLAEDFDFLDAVKEAMAGLS